MRFNNASRAGAPLVHQVTVILDCAGLGMSTLYQHAMRCLKVAADNDQRFYPESLHKLYVVNCPKIISYAWNIVKPWLDERCAGARARARAQRCGSRCAQNAKENILLQGPRNRIQAA